MTNIRKILALSLSALTLSVTPMSLGATRYHQSGKHISEGNGITYHKKAHTFKRPSSIEAYRGYSTQRTDIEIRDGYLTVIAAIYSDQAKQAYIFGAYEGKDKTHLKPLCFPNTIKNTIELLREREGITKVHL